MASIYAHPKSGIFHVAFWYDSLQHRKSLRTRNKRKAQEDAQAVQRAVGALKSGRDKEGLDLIRKGIAVLDVIFPTAKVKEMLAASNQKPLLLRDLHDRWIQHQTHEGRAARTVKTTRHRLVHFRSLFGDDFRVDHLAKADLEKYMIARRKDGIAEYTLNRELKALKGVINKAVEFEWLNQNPLKSWPRVKPEARKEFMPKEQVEELMATTQMTDEEVEDLRSRMLLAAKDISDLVDLAKEKMPELAVPLALVGVTAIRRTELVTARRADLNMTKWTLSVSSDKGSSKRRQVRRTIEIHQSVVPMLKEHLTTLKKSDKLLFPIFGQINGGIKDSDNDVGLRCDRANRLLSKLVEGTPWVMLKGWHTLRHSAISIYLDQGYTFDHIAKWTGHVDPETQKLYTHWFDRQARDRMDKVPFEFNNGAKTDHISGEGDKKKLSKADVEKLIAENRSLKAQLRMMQAGRAKVESLQRRIQVLEGRLSGKG